MIKEINKLRKETGCSMINCKKAIIYSEKHKECTPIGYLKAVGIAVKTNCNFEERVKIFSKER